MNGPLTVAGMPMRMQVRAGREIHRYLGGPVFGAAVGAAVHGADVTLMAALSAEDASEPLVRLLDRAGDLVDELPVPPLRWSGPTVCGEGSPAAVEGDACAWRARTDPAVLDGQRCALANADPRWYARLLRYCAPRFAAIDLSGEWLSFCAPAVRECLSRVHLVTMTEADHRALPRTALEGVRLGYHGGPALIVKRGHKGVVVRCGGVTTELAPPQVAHVRADVGAGDVLLGCLAAQLGAPADGLRSPEVCEAYQSSTGTVARLLSSASFEEFWRAALRARISVPSASGSPRAR
jgi:sugar/nucleoside kinase (ribokinase family)